MIVTERLNIIPLERRHIFQLRKIRLEFNTWHYLTDPHPINDLQQEKWFERMSNDPTKMYFAIEGKESIVDKGKLSINKGKINKTDLGKLKELSEVWNIEGKFIGILRADEYDRTNRSIRIGVDIDKSERNKGYGTEAMKAFMDYLFKHLNIHMIWLLVAESNLPAIKLYAKVGFKRKGVNRQALFRDGKWINYELWNILEAEWKINTK